MLAEGFKRMKGEFSLKAWSNICFCQVLSEQINKVCLRKELDSTPLDRGAMAFVNTDSREVGGD